MHLQSRAVQHQCFKAIHTGRRVHVAANKPSKETAGGTQFCSDQQLPCRQQQQQHSPCSKRQWLVAGATAVIIANLPVCNLQQPLPAAAGAAVCELQTSAATGLKWCDIVAGSGALPIKGAFTKAQYTAKLASTGVVFDSTYQRKAPLIFKVGEHELIEALDVAMLGAEDMPPMREGGRRLVVAPPGPMQRQGTKSLLWVVGLSQALEDAGELSPEGTPTSDLVFEIELLAKRQR